MPAMWKILYKKNLTTPIEREHYQGESKTTVLEKPTMFAKNKRILFVGLFLLWVKLNLC